MKTRGQVIKEYKIAFKNGTEGGLLLERFQQISALGCSNNIKAIALKHEIDHIICGYMDSVNESN